MTTAAPPADEAEAPPAKGGKKKLLLIALVPLVLAGAGAGLWFSGLLPFGKSDHAAGHASDGHGTPAGAAPAHGPSSAPAHAPSRPPILVDMPEILTNLNVTGRRATFIRLRAKLEVSEADAAAVNAAMPRLMDLFQTYLREMRPEELRGSQGTYRLREELRNRATLAIGTGKVTDVLFVEMIVQ